MMRRVANVSQSCNGLGIPEHEVLIEVVLFGERVSKNINLKTSSLELQKGGLASLARPFQF